MKKEKGTMKVVKGTDLKAKDVLVLQSLLGQIVRANGKSGDFNTKFALYAKGAQKKISEASTDYRYKLEDINLKYALTKEHGEVIFNDKNEYVYNKEDLAKRKKEISDLVETFDINLELNKIDYSMLSDEEKEFANPNLMDEEDLYYFSLIIDNIPTTKTV